MRKKKLLKVFSQIVTVFFWLRFKLETLDFPLETIQAK